MRDHSHHFIMYTYDANATNLTPEGVIRELGEDMERFTQRQFFIGAQEAEFTYEFPSGAAISLPANAGVDLNSHYVNGDTKPITGEVYANLHTTSDVQRLAQNLLWNNTQFVLPPQQTTVLRDTLTLPADVDVFSSLRTCTAAASRFEFMCSAARMMAS